jgi:DNA gyrase inhibitor GyrI
MAHSLSREKSMKKSHYGSVRIKKLKPMRVASYRAISATPENDSIEHMTKWLEKQEFGGTGRVHMFGFDAEVIPEQQKKGLRGYEVWASIPKDIKPSGGVTVKDFTGGTYAVMRIDDPFTNPFEVIPGGWNRLVGWVKTSDEYEFGEHQCLEELIKIEGEDCLDVHLPVVKKGTRK